MSAALTYFDVVFLFFFTSCVGVTQLVSRSFSEESIPYASAGSMGAREEGSSGSSSVVVLNQNCYFQSTKLCALNKSGRAGKSQ